MNWQSIRSLENQLLALLVSIYHSFTNDIASDKLQECKSVYLSYYDTKIQDVPIKNTCEFKVIPWFELQYYPTSDLDDIEAPFAEGIDHIAMIEESLETRTHPEDKRIQHLDFRNITFADAILKGALSSKKQAQEEDG